MQRRRPSKHTEVKAAKAPPRYSERVPDESPLLFSCPLFSLIHPNSGHLNPHDLFHSSLPPLVCLHSSPSTRLPVVLFYCRLSASSLHSSLLFCSALSPTAFHTTLFNLILFIACLYFPSYLLSLFLLLRLIVIFRSADCAPPPHTPHLCKVTKETHRRDTQRKLFGIQNTNLWEKSRGPPTPTRCPLADPFPWPLC